MSASAITITAIVLSKRNRLQFAAATVQSGGQPQWRLCLEVVLPNKASNPVQIVEQLCSGTDPSVILVCQQDARSLLLHRYAHDTLTLVDSSSTSCTSWWPSVPSAWESTLKAHWQVADMIYTHARRIHQAQLLPLPVDVKGSLFERYRYRPTVEVVDVEVTGVKTKETEQEVGRETMHGNNKTRCI